MNKVKVAFIVIILLIIFLISIGLSFALWYIKDGQTDNNNLTSGCFDILFSEDESSNITIENAFSILEEDSDQLEPYVFTLTNNCDVAAKYNVNLELLENTTLDEQFIRVKLNEQVAYDIDHYPNTTSTIEGSTAYNIFEGVLEEGEVKSFEFKMWMNERATLDNSQNKTILSKITVSSVPSEPSNFTIVDNLSLLTDGELLSENPNRGFRGETRIYLKSNTSYEGTSPYDQLLSSVRHNGGVNLTQAYIYLNEYYDDPYLDQAAFDNLLAYFNKAKELDIKLLVRFAYETDMNLNWGPTTQTIVNHSSQLGEWFDNNIDLVNDVVYGFQLGFIGAWGEGHSGFITHDYGTVITAVLDMVPEEHTVMVREYKFYAEASEEEQKRLSFHDDYFVGEQHSWGMKFEFPSPEYQEMFYKTRTTISDGEMPWGHSALAGEYYYSTEKIVNLIGEYGFSSFSLAHNFKEWSANQVEPYELDKAQTYPLTEEFLIDNKLPYNPAMLNNGVIMAFDYIDYHLGYQLGLSNYSYENNTLSFVLNNFGVGAPVNLNIRISSNNNILFEGELESLLIGQNSHYKFSFSNFTSSDIQVEIYNVIDDLNVRLANDITYSNGIHTLTIN